MTQYIEAHKLYIVKPITVTRNTSMWHGGVTGSDKEIGVQLPNVLRYVMIPDL